MGDQMKTDELGRACGAYGTREVRRELDEGKGRDHLEDLDLDGGIVLKLNLKK